MSVDEHIKQIEMKRGDELFSMFIKKPPTCGFQVIAMHSSKTAPIFVEEQEQRRNALAVFDKTVAERAKDGYSVVFAWTRDFQSYWSAIARGESDEAIVRAGEERRK